MALIGDEYDSMLDMPRSQRMMTNWVRVTSHVMSTLTVRNMSLTESDRYELWEWMRERVDAAVTSNVLPRSWSLLSKSLDASVTGSLTRTACVS
jgi:hypothetical protein